MSLTVRTSVLKKSPLGFLESEDPVSKQFGVEPYGVNGPLTLTSTSSSTGRTEESVLIVRSKEILMSYVFMYGHPSVPLYANWLLGL